MFNRFTSALAVLLALVTAFVLSTSAAGADASHDWSKLARELAELKLSPELAAGYLAYEESVVKEGDYWVVPTSMRTTDFSWPGSGGRSPAPDSYYDLLQHGHLGLTPSVGGFLGVKPAELPAWKELTRQERLQLFSTFKAPESWLNSTPVRPPLHLTLAGQMAQHDMSSIGGLPELLECAFGDPETSYRLWVDRSAHHDWKLRFTRRYLRFILNHQTLGFFEPWHQEFSAGNGFIQEISGNEARTAILEGLKAMAPELLENRLSLSPAQASITEGRSEIGTVGYFNDAFRGERQATLVKGALAAGELWKWCRPYYFRVYGANRVVAEGIVLAPRPEAARTYRLRVLHGHSGEGYIVQIANEAYGFSRTGTREKEGMVDFWGVPAYVLDGLSYSVFSTDARIRKVVSADMVEVAPGEIEVTLHYQ